MVKLNLLYYSQYYGVTRTLVWSKCKVQGEESDFKTIIISERVAEYDCVHENEKQKQTETLLVKEMWSGNRKFSKRYEKNRFTLFQKCKAL